MISADTPSRTRAEERQLAGPPTAIVCGDLNLLRCLVGRNIPLLVVASDPHEATLRSRHAVRAQLIHDVSEAELALEDLAALGKGWRQRPVLYYGTDGMLLLVARNRARLERHFRFTMPAPELVESLVDKACFYPLAVNHGIPVPLSVASADLVSAEDLLAKLPLPHSFKPSVHIGWMRERAEHDNAPQKALRAATRDESRRLYDELSAWGPFVVQRWIPGGEDAIFSFHCYSDEHARVLGWFVGKKVRTYPKRAGVSTCVELCRDEAVARLGLDIVERLGIAGPLKIDFKRDAESGELCVLELNPRFSLWCYLGAECGVNLPKLAYAHLVGERIPRQESYRTDVRWVSFGNDLRSFVRSYHPSGEITLVDYLASLSGKKIYDVFSWRDPLPWLYSVASYGKAASRRMGRGAALRRVASTRA